MKEMMKKILPRTLIVALIVLLNVGCDQISKSIARDEIAYNDRIEVVGDFFILTKVENTGAFLSLGSGLSPVLRKVLLTVIPCIILIVAIILVIRSADTSVLFLLGFCFIIGGGIGNLWDRVLYESVTDFMNMGIGDLRTGIFNMADLSISFGMVMVLVDQLFFAKKEEPPKATEELPAIKP